MEIELSFENADAVSMSMNPDILVVQILDPAYF